MDASGDNPEEPSGGEVADGLFLEYWAGNPSVEITHGHICYAGDVLPSGPPLPGGCVVLASSVPCYMSPPEFCDFVGAFAMETHRQFRHCRILHGKKPEEYLVAMWLASPEFATGIIEKFHGKPYNALEAALCSLHVVVGCSQAIASADSQETMQTMATSAQVGAPQNRARRPAARSPLSSPVSLPVLPLEQQSLPRKTPAVRTPDEPESIEGMVEEMLEPEDLFRSLLPSRCAALASSSQCSCPAAAAAAVGSSSSTCSVCLEPIAAGASSSTCTVCLEPIESQPDTYQLSELGGGVPLTILCGHTFHARCLSRWCDSTCPVCRFQQHPYQVSCCDVCGKSDALHICLVCGFIGCVGADHRMGAALSLEGGSSSAEAAAAGGHAMWHFETTRHTYALEVQTSRVWDYAGNGYVHRLLTNSEDGKMVEHSAPDADLELRRDLDAQFAGQRTSPGLSRAGRHSSGSAADGPKKARKKEESLVSEFNALLASQMTAQRRFYEDKQREQEQEQKRELEILASRRQGAASTTEAARQRLQTLQRGSAALEEEIAKAIAEEEVMTRQLQALEGLNERIAGEQRKYEARQDDARVQVQLAKEKRTQEVQELQQQVKDLELYIQMQRRCEKMHDPADLQGGVVVITESDKKGSGRGRRPRRRGG